MRKKIFFLTFFTLIAGLPFTMEAFSVAPQKIEIAGDPGEIILSGISLFSNESKSQNYSVSFENFRPKSDSGVPEFIGDLDGLATWFSSEQEVYLGEGGEVFFPFSINVPLDAKPGGYFSAIFFEPENSNKQTLIDEKIGVLVFLRVNGDIVEDGRILSFSLKDNKKIVSKEPLYFEYRFENDGDDRVIPEGDITLFNMLGKEVGKTSINNTSGNVLPGSFRKFDVLFGDQRQTMDTSAGFFDIVRTQYRDFKLGFYTALISIEWSESDIGMKKYKFFIIPWHLLLVVSLFLLFISVIGYRFLNLYRNHIIQSSQIREKRSLRDDFKK